MATMACWRGGDGRVNGKVVMVVDGVAMTADEEAVMAVW